MQICDILQAEDVAHKDYFVKMRESIGKASLIEPGQFAK